MPTNPESQDRTNENKEQGNESLKQDSVDQNQNFEGELNALDSTTAKNYIDAKIKEGKTGEIVNHIDLITKKLELEDSKNVIDSIVNSGEIATRMLIKKINSIKDDNDHTLINHTIDSIANNYKGETKDNIMTEMVQGLKDELLGKIKDETLTNFVKSTLIDEENYEECIKNIADNQPIMDRLDKQNKLLKQEIEEAKRRLDGDAGLDEYFEEVGEFTAEGEMEKNLPTGKIHVGPLEVIRIGDEDIPETNPNETTGGENQGSETTGGESQGPENTGDLR